MDWGSVFWIVVALVVVFVIGIATIDGFQGYFNRADEERSRRKSHKTSSYVSDEVKGDRAAVPVEVNQAAGDSSTLKSASPPAPGQHTEVLMPQMGESVTEGTLTKWLKKVGDVVALDEPIFEISTEKVDAEIPAPIAGILSDIKVHVGATVIIGTPVCTIGGTVAQESTATQPRACEEDVRLIVLEISRDCSLAELQAAYRRQAALWHPDKVEHLAPEIRAFAEGRMVVINDAYQSLRRDFT